MCASGGKHCAEDDAAKRITGTQFQDPIAPVLWGAMPSFAVIWRPTMGGLINLDAHSVRIQ
ncbi:hypothetical protein Hdeb2414_s0010g00347891 [Helianthus debilis subsp. tardiflorus]